MLPTAFSRIRAFARRLLHRGVPTVAQAADRARSAVRHYQLGNRSYDRDSWAEALAEWRAAAALWRDPRHAGRALLHGLMQLRAAVLLLLTVLLVYNLVFHFFPRSSFEMFVMGAIADQQELSWWQRFLNTGRPQQGGGHKMDMREWWDSMTRRLFGEGDAIANGQQGGGRPSIEERWADLLKRHGRWGPLYNWDLDYHIVAGYGLSRLEDYSDAVAIFEKGIREAKGDTRLADLWQGLANTHYNEGYRLQPDGLATYDLGYVKKAVTAYEKSAKYEERPLSLGNLGWMYFLLGDYDRAERYSERSLSMDRGLDYVRLNLGLIHLMQNKVDAAFEAYRSVLQRNPPEDVYLGGINDLREVIRDNPGRFPYAQLMMGLLAIKSGDYTRAHESLSTFLASPYIGEGWRRLATRLVEELDAAPVER